MSRHASIDHTERHPPRPASAIADAVRRLGGREGDVVMVHASLRAIGPVAGGANGVLDALATVLGPGGTLLMTLGARNDWDWVNERPEPERPPLLLGAAPFDALTAPAETDVGALAEVFRTRRGTVVSDHPEGRFASCGRLAEHLTDDVPWDDYYGPGSPLERFTEAGGRVLRLGADIDTVTLTHHAEYLVDLPNKRRVRRHRVVHGTAGPELRVVECLDDSDGIVEWTGGDYFAAIMLSYLAAGRAEVGKVGDATCELLEALDFVPYAVAWMAEHLPVG